MSDEQAANTTVVETGTEDGVEIRLRPEDIAINKTFENLRSDRQSDLYQQEVKRLSLVLKDEGQKQPVLIRTNTTGTEHGYELVFGHRRREAVALLAAKDSEVMVLCRFEDLDDDQAMKAALRENIQAKDFSDMDKARICMGLRVAKMKTKDIAEYLGVSTATVTELERLLNLPKDVQERVETGELSKSAALEVAPVAEGKRKTVVEKAKEKAEKDKAAAVAAAEKKGQKAKAEKLKKEPAKVQGKHVRQAVRETAGAVAKQKAPSRADILSMIEALTGPAIAKPVAQTFACMELWIRGELTDKQFKAAVGDLEDCISRDRQSKGIAAARHLEKPQKPQTAEKTTKPAKAVKKVRAVVKKKPAAKAKAKKKHKLKVVAKAKGKQKRPAARAA